MTHDTDLGLQTRAIHSHQAADPQTGAVIVPIYQTSTFQHESVGQHKGYEYSRTGNPTRTALEGCLADMEGGVHGLCFTTGMGALTTMSMALFKPGDHVLCGQDIYGGAFRFFDKVFKPFGVAIEFIDMTDPAHVASRVRPTTKALYLETPTNPLLKLVDLEAMVAIARQNKLLTILDNTFATPILQQALPMGVDVILHSTTKYVAGHSDVLGGALITNDEELFKTLKFHQNAIGATPDPFACWLILRGLKTLPLRMKAHTENAMLLAQFLENHPGVENVIYPGLASHPQHALAQKQMTGFGGMIAARIRGGEAAAGQFMKALKFFALAESLGGVESLISMPARMTHGAVPPEQRLAMGITDNLVRLSVGIEDIADLKRDLSQALEKTTATTV